MTEQQREAARLLAAGIPATQVARMVGISVRQITRWKAIPGFADAVQAAAATTPDLPVTDATPVEVLRQLAKSPREDVRFRASAKLADLEAKAAIEQIANQPQARGATYYVPVRTGPPDDYPDIPISEGRFAPYECEVQIDLPAGSPDRIVLHRGPPLPPKPYIPHPDPVVYGQAVEE